MRQTGFGQKCPNPFQASEAHCNLQQLRFTKQIGHAYALASKSVPQRPGMDLDSFVQIHSASCLAHNILNSIIWFYFTCC